MYNKSCNPFDASNNNKNIKLLADRVADVH